MLIRVFSSAFLLYILTSTKCDGLRILVCFPMASKSHSILGHGFTNRLLDAGHEVVHLTSFPRNISAAGLRELNTHPVMDDILKYYQKEMDGFKLKNMVKNDMTNSIGFLFISFEFHKRLLESKDIQELLGDPNEKFDVVVAEWFFSEALAGIAPLFKAPLVWAISTDVHWQVIRIMDEIPNTAYTTDILSKVIPPLSLWQRAVQLFITSTKAFILEVIMSPMEKHYIYNNIYLPLAVKRGVEMPSYEEAKYNGSMALVNSHPSIGTPYKLPQNVKYIGGYHIPDKTDPLSQDLQKIMNNAKEGVIYFSMGSNLKSEDMSDEMKASLLSMFGKLEQTVIWKFESNMNDVPPNVHLVKWAPQLSILEHPNVKIFITHGGLLSTTEAIHHGVPVIGMPVMADQFVNMKSVTNKGFGLMLYMDDDIADRLYVAIGEILKKNTYKLKAQKLSALHHDRPVTAGQEMVYWVEYVARHEGAAHLRSPAVTMHWYQKCYLDLVIVILTPITLLYIMIKKFFKSTSTKVDKKKKKN